MANKSADDYFLSPAVKLEVGEFKQFILLTCKFASIFKCKPRRIAKKIYLAKFAHIYLQPNAWEFFLFVQKFLIIHDNK
jgi:hypothetical protein